MKNAQQEISPKLRKRPMGVLRRFSRLPFTLTRLVGALRDLVDVLTAALHQQQEAGNAIKRLEALELSRNLFEAEMRGLVMEAEGKFRAANNSEARERALKKSYARLADPLDEESAEVEAAPGNPDSGDNGAGSEAERLHAMRLDVAPTNPKELAIRAKFYGGK